MERSKENIISQQLKEAISERYLAYAMSTIVSRSLPDVRDGLKPVHRRLLYAMRGLKLDPKSGYKKCARVVGDVMGKYHPHGDSSIYDAMVRLAQSFSVRYPLVEGQGNFGNVDGDSAAAMRYTEAKLTEASMFIMDSIDEGTVDFIPTYSGEEEEPAVMPAMFPNLLANGATGIAVGMATSIPPHNITELCDAIVAIIKKPEMDTTEIVNFIHGPDFPTGGILYQDKDSIIQAYETGRGTFRIRAKWEREDLAYGSYQIVIKEIPYGVGKSRLIEKIAELMEAGRLPLVGDIRDESAEDIRIVIEPKSRTTSDTLIMAQLFMLTELDTKFPLNMNVLDKNCVPSVMGLKSVLLAFIEHRKEVLTRKSQFRIANILRRLEVLGGYLVAYLNLDEVIAIIRENDEPKVIFISKFQLSDIQAEAILNMRLRSLRKLEEIEIKAEAKNLNEEKDGLEKIISDDVNKLKYISEETKTLKSLFMKNKRLADRLTLICNDLDDCEIPVDSFVVREPITVIISNMGWIRAVKNHIDLGGDFNFKDGDSLYRVLHTQTLDKLIFATSSGQFFTLDAGKISTGRGYGEPIRLLLEIPQSSEIIDIFVADEGEVLLASRLGFGFRVGVSDLIASTKNGKLVMNVDSLDNLAIVRHIKGEDTVAIVGNNRKLLVFPIADVPNFSRGKGVILQKYKEAGVFLSDIKLFKRQEGFTFANGSRNHKIPDVSMWIGKRASVGHMPPDGFPKTNKFNKE